MDIILTGIARSGTTLSCSLLNKLPQCVALHEPMQPDELVDLRFPEAYMERIASFFAAQRASLLSSGTAVTKARDGLVPDNSFSPPAEGTGLRVSNINGREAHFQKRLLPDFRLVIKHPNFFTATLSTLLTRYSCYALIRNPLAVLLSWHSVKAPMNQGRLPAAEAFDSDLKSQLEAEPDRLGRQLIILRWYYTRYASLLPRDHVIRYEELISSGGSALAVIDPDAAGLNEALASRNMNTLYDAGLVSHMAGRLLDDPSVYDAFYGQKEIEDLSKCWTQNI